MSRPFLRTLYRDALFRLALIVAFFAVVLIAFERNRLLDDLYQRLATQAAVLSVSVETSNIRDEATISQLVATYRFETSVQVAVFGGRGQLIAASHPELPTAVAEGLRAARVAGTTLMGPRGLAADRAAIVNPILNPQNDTIGYLVAADNLHEFRSALAAAAIFAVAVIIAVGSAIVVVGLQIVREITIPLAELEAAAGQFAMGKLDYRCRIVESSELRSLGETFNSMATQLQQRIDAIRDQRRELQAILSAMIEGVILVDAEHRVRTINAAARRLFRADDETGIEGRYLLDVVRSSEIDAFVEETRTSRPTNEREIQLFTTPPQHIQLHGTQVDTVTGEGVLLVFNDITRLKHLENIRRDFVANVSHELKTPITSIVGFVETLLDGAIEEQDQARQFLGIIAGQSHRLNAIIEDLLQLSRLEQNDEQIPLKESRLEEVIGAVRQQVIHQAQLKEIDIRDEFHGSTNVLINPTLLIHALNNLVDNAIKYCPKGSVVTIRCSNEAKNLQLQVIDNGPGIPDAAKSRLFERFYRVDRARSRDLGGTGLGLAIVKHIARAHSGTVSVESTVGAGSTFTIDIPQGIRRPNHERPKSRSTI